MPLPLGLELPIGDDEVLELQRHTTSVVQAAELRIAKTLFAKLPKRRQAQILAQSPTDQAFIHAVGRPAETTSEAYRKRGRSLWDDNDQFGAWHVWMVLTRRCNTKNSWYASRSALLFFLLEELRKRKRAIDSWRKAPNGLRLPRDVLDMLCVEAAGFSEALEALPDPGFLPDKFAKDGSHRSSSHSKSSSIAGLPSDWRLLVAAQLQPRFRQIYLLQCVSGCRPVELDREHGVTARLTPAGHLVVTTVGAKLSETAGQEARELTFEKPTGLALELIKTMRPGTISISSAALLESLFKHGKVENYGAVVAAAGARAFPKLKPKTAPQGAEKSKAGLLAVAKSKGMAPVAMPMPFPMLKPFLVANETDPLKPYARRSVRVTAYSARHQFKADLVAAGWERGAIAMAMGHRTERSAVHYARKGARSSGGVVPTRATATHQAIKKRSAPSAARAAKSLAGPVNLAKAKAKARSPRP